MTEFDVDCPRCKRIRESAASRQQSTYTAHSVPQAPPAPPTPQAPPVPPETNFNYSITQEWSIGPNSTRCGKRSNVAAGLFALFLGGLGIHKFYNGSYGWGILYIVLVWTYVPMVVAFIEGIIYLCDGDGYDKKYNRVPPEPFKW